jgi:hypothetical protein
MNLRQIIWSAIAAVGIGSLLTVLPTTATEQFSEKITIQGEQQALVSEPLADYLQLPGNFQKFSKLVGLATCTALWRGYLGEWEIREQKLYLIRLRNSDCGRSGSLSLPDIFNGKQSPIFADWYSGELIVPQDGRGVDGEFYDRYLSIEIRKGKVVSQKIRRRR